MSIATRTLESRSEPLWAAYVQAHPDGTLFHTLAWRDAVSEVFGHQAEYLTAWRGEAMVGVFPLMRVASRLAGVILVSVPYGVYGGALADDDEAYAALLARARELAGETGARWVDIRSAEARHPGLPMVEKYVTYRKRLPTEPEAVLAHLPRKARAAARHARERHALRVEFDDRHLPTVWDLYSQSMRRLASPNYPLRFFRALLERTGHDACDPTRPGHVVEVVLRGDLPVAGLVSFVYRGVFLPYFVGCDERFEKYHPNNLLYTAAMEEGVRIGCEVFDFGRSRADNVGPCEFKRNQGFEPSPLGYQYYVPSGGRAPDLHPDNPRMQLARRVWPCLPLAVTRPLGAWLARSIPG